MAFDYDGKIDEMTRKVKAAQQNAVQGGPTQNLGTGATEALFNLAMAVFQLCKLIDAASPQPASAPAAAAGEAPKT